ncbi:MAG: patatin-like phospholipase family protein, partial [Myxococcales bacterium]|nr:patatin-like phospholipase family protein [Myxococcales bacterium]
MARADRPGIVLSGGGARGAYEVGVVSGVVEVLGRGPKDPPPFRVFTGTSVGAINATWLAAHTDRGDLDVAGLAQVWTDLRLPVHLRLDPLRLLGLKRIAARWLDREHLGPSILDPRPLDAVVAHAIPWERLHANARTGALHALVVAALEVATGRTTLFHETGPDCEFRPSRDPRRRAWPGPIEVDQVLASAAIPLVFPARRVGHAWFCDGGLRFNTPIAP